MNHRALIFVCFILSVTISGCSDQYGTTNFKSMPKIAPVVAVGEVSEKTLTNILEKGDILEQRLENEPSLACQMAFSTTAKAVKMQTSANLSSEHPRIELAPHHVFMKDCFELPRKVQMCLVDQYAFKHIDSCQEARRAYDRTLKHAHNG